MKHSWTAPPTLQALSYRVLPSRRRVISLLENLHESAQDLEEVQIYIRRQLEIGEPFLLGRPGGTESEGLYFFLHHRLAARKAGRKPYSEWFRKYAKIYSGINHQSDADLDQFNRIYLESILASDMLAFGKFAPGSLGLTRTARDTGSQICHFESLEPWKSLQLGIDPWTLGLADKKVLIVHPFTESIHSQLRRRTKVTGVKDFLPPFSYEVVSPPVTFADGATEKSWVEYHRELVGKVSAKNFDVAIIGAGSYGLPLAAAIKESGRQAIHLGGITQLLFGILGSRWETQAEIRRIVDSTWVRPREEERPNGHQPVEKGAYW